MSSSFRKSARFSVAVTCAVAAAAALPLEIVSAAQTYVQPQVDLRLEANDNWDLDPSGGDDAEANGYVADLQALFGIATPRSDTSVRPRIRLQEYPDRDDISGFEGFLNLRSIYRWEASDLSVVAKYSHQDLYNAELPREAFDQFDPLDPNYGSDADAGRVIAGVVRDRFHISPAYSYRLSERLRVGATMMLDSSRYDEDVRVDYDYWNVGGSASWSLYPRTEIGADVYTSRYEATDDTTKTDAVGVGASFVHRYSENAGVQARMFYESNEVEEFSPSRTDDSTSGWGGNLTAFVNGEISQWRFTLEQGFWPTGDGGKKETSQFRAQYWRDVTQRLRVNGMARYFRERAIGSADNEDDRDFARLELSLRHMFGRTWYVSGGYAYVWQEYVSDVGDASNNQLFLSVGYQGLDRPRR